MKKKSLILILLIFIWNFFFINLLDGDNNQKHFKNVKVKNISETSAIIAWETDIKSTGQVSFGSTAKYLRNVSIDVNKSTEHNVYLRGLEKGTVYYYRARIKIGNQYIDSAIYNFKTAGIPLPKLLKSNVEIVDPTTAKVHYELNTPCQMNMTYMSKDIKNQIFSTNYYDADPV